MWSMRPEKAEKLALDAHSLGEKAAAKRNKVSERTIYRAAAQVASDPVLAESVNEKKIRMSEELHDQRVEVIRLMLDGMKRRLPSMEDRDFVGAYKIVTDSHEVALRVIHGSESRPVHRREDRADKQVTPDGSGEVFPVVPPVECIDYSPAHPAPLQ